MSDKFISVYKSDIHNSIDGIVHAGSELKHTIFDVLIMGKSLEEKKIRIFEAEVNNFLKKWDDHADALIDKIESMKSLSKPAGRCIDYDDVKSYIYAKHDYASLLQFVDGCLQGIKDGKFSKKEDIEDFKEHTISMAFKEIDPSLQELLEEIDDLTVYTDMDHKMELIDIRYFDNVRHSKDLFNYRDRPELFKAITVILKYIMTNEIIPKDINYKNVKLFISLVNNIVEYILYSVSVYATRIYVISSFCQPFINLSMREGDYEEKTFIEAAAVEKITLPKIPTNEAMLTSIPDELIVKDPYKANQLFDRFQQFMNLTGATNHFETLPTLSTGYYSGRYETDNTLLNELKENPLYEFLMKNHLPDQYQLKEVDVTAFNSDLKNFMYNKHFGLGGSHTPKNDIIIHIRGWHKGDSVEGYQKTSAELYVVAIKMANRIITMIKNCVECFNNELAQNRQPLMVRKMLGESEKILIELYEESMFAFAQKFAYIEKRIEEIRPVETQNLLNKTSINIKSDLDLYAATSASAPVTTRMPLEHLDLYSIPIFEELELYDEYLMTQPIFENDWYFSEAEGGLRYSTLINTIISFLQSAFRSISDTLFRNLKPATDWVKANEENLSHISWNADATIGPAFKFNIDLNPNGSTESVINRFSEALKNYDNTKGSEALYNSIFKDENERAQIEKNEGGLEKLYRDRALFGEGAQDKDKEAVTYTGDGKNGSPKIEDGFKIWKQDLLQAEEVGKRLNSMNKKLLDAFNTAKPKLINPSTSSSSTTSTSETDKAAPPTPKTESVFTEGNAENKVKAQAIRQKADPKAYGAGIEEGKKNKAGASGTADKAADNGEEIKATDGQGGTDNNSNTGNAIAKIQQAINIIWTPVHKGICEALKSEYKYLKAAYEVRAKNGNNPDQ